MFSSKTLGYLTLILLLVAVTGQSAFSHDERRVLRAKATHKPTRRPTGPPSATSNVAANGPATQPPLVPCGYSATAWVKALNGSNDWTQKPFNVKNWGWTNGPYLNTTAVTRFEIWMGAGQSNTNKGYLAGTGNVTLSAAPAQATIRYTITYPDVVATGDVKAYISPTNGTALGPTEPGQMPITVTNGVPIPSPKPVPKYWYFYIHFNLDRIGGSCGGKTSMPTSSPITSSPSASPTTSSPSQVPTNSPITSSPSAAPSKSPITSSPSQVPTNSPITSKPSAAPSRSPTTSSPSQVPTNSPITSKPSAAPSKSPTTSSPSQVPTNSPVTSKPSAAPSKSPTTSSPSQVPTNSPITSKPSAAPSKSPTTSTPTFAPSNSPTNMPTTPPPSPLPCGSTGTGWSKASGDYSNYAHCWLNPPYVPDSNGNGNKNNTGNWGWDNGAFTQTNVAYTYDIWFGAGGCDTTAGTLVGNGTVTLLNASFAQVTYQFRFGNILTTDISAYIGTTPFYVKGGNNITSPGQLPYNITQSPQTLQLTKTSPVNTNSWYFYIHFGISATGGNCSSSG